MADLNKKVKIEVDSSDAIKTINELLKVIKDVLKEIEKSGNKTEQTIENTGNQVEKTTKKVKELDKVSFGNVINKFNDLKDSFKAGEIGLIDFGKGILSVGKALVATFIANPIGIIITGIVTAVTALVAIFKTFTPVVEKVQQIWAGLTAGFDRFKNAVTGWISGNKSFKESFTGLGESMRDAAAAARELKQAEQDLEDQQILLELSNANLQNQIDRLLLQSRDRTKSESERLKLIDQAMKLEQQRFDQTKKVNDDEIRLAEKNLANLLGISEEKLRIIGVEGALKLNSTQINADKEIGILKDLYLKRASLENQKIQLDEKTQNRRNQILERQEVEKEKTKQKEKELWDDVRKNEKEARDAMLENEKDFNETMDEMFQDIVEADNKAADERIASENRVSDAKQQIANEEAKKKFEKIQKDLDDEKAINDARIELARSSLEAISTLDQAFTSRALDREKQLLSSKLISQVEYDRRVAEIQKKAAQREKAYAVASTSINTAASIMNMLTVKPAEAGVILAIAAGVLGAAQIAAILATPIDGTTPATSNASSTSNLQQATGTAPNTSFSFSPTTTTPQIQPVRTYVISKDVNTQQQLDRQVIANGTI